MIIPKKLVTIFSLLFLHSIVIGEHKKEDYDASHTALPVALVLAAIAGGYVYANQSKPQTIPNANQSNIKAIIFDMDGVLSTTNKLRAFQQTGITDTFSYMLGQMTIPCEKILFDTLAGVPAQSKYTSYNKGLQMPQIMIDWQTGAQNIEKIRKDIIEHVTSLAIPESQKKWVIQTALMMTDPEKFVSTRQMIAGNINLLHELKEKSYKLYVLSNWDPQSFKLFQQQFPGIFMYQGQPMFDGIMISGEINIPKPHLDVFKKCLKKFKLQPECTVFIDDEPANIAAATQHKIKTVLSNPHDTAKTRKDLIDILINILTI